MPDAAVEGLLREVIAEQVQQREMLVAILRVLERGRGARDAADLSSNTKRAHLPLFLSRADRARLGHLLPAIGGALGSEPFLARDLFEHDAAGLRLVRRGLTAKRIGRLFQRAEGQVIDGYVIERAGDELHTTLWRVMEVSGSRLPAIPPHVSRDLA